MSLQKKYLILWLFPSICLAEPLPSDDPCASLLALVDRPTASDSACSVKFGEAIIEVGYQYENVYPGSGHINNYPELLARVGLPGLNEISVLLPNYIQQNVAGEGTAAGMTATVVGLKHQFQNLPNIVYAAETLVTLPTGSDAFGSDSTGIAVNGLFNYSFTSTISAELGLGYSSQSTSFDDGGERYDSIFQDVVLTWQPLAQLEFYIEAYGESKTGPDEHSGYNADAGILYLLTECIALDVEYGHRLSGELGNFSQYFGFGGSIRF